MTQYTILYKKKFEPQAFFLNTSYDVFISVFNDSERVKSTFSSVNANQKFWLVLPEYGYSEHEYPTDGNVIIIKPGLPESEVVIALFEDNGIDIDNDNICIDITGFIRPHLIYLVRYLSANTTLTIDFIYSDPTSYVKKEDTSFSSDYLSVKQIDGCEGNHTTDTENDILIIGSGYDYKRIADVSRYKINAKKVQIFGFPPLQPDMYQENILKAYQAEDASSISAIIDPDYSLFAPANDPFVTAEIIHQFVQKEEKKKHITNLYLSPLSTKAQALGFAIYYVSECVGKEVSVVFPYCNNYSRETTVGLSKIWKYSVDFAALRTS